MAIQLKGSRSSFSSLSPSRLNNPLRLSRLLVAIDFSAGSINALRFAEALARQFGASLALLHVVEPICEIYFGYGSVVRHCQNREVLKNAQSRLKALSRRLAGPSNRPLTLVRIGTAETEIIDAARQLESDLIIMGTRGNWHPAGTPAGSTAEKVLRRAPCPVLIIRNKENTIGWRRKRQKS